MNKTKRQELVDRLMNKADFPHSEVVDDVDKWHRLIYKMLRRRGNYEIIMSKDKDKSTLWFLRRKD